MTRKKGHLLAVVALLLVCVPFAWAADRGTINSGETKTGLAINGPSYLDTWTFQGSAGDRAIINVVKTSGNLDTKIIVYPPGGGNAEALSSCTDIMGFYNGCRDQLDMQLQHTGLYTIVIQDYALVNPGTYNITLLEIPGALNSSEDPDGSAIASGQTLSGAINVPSDTDAFQFYGTAGDRAIINVVKTSGNLDTKIIVYPPGGDNAETLSSCTDIMGFYNGCRDQLDFQLQHAGLYTIVIQDYALVNPGTYNITLLEIPGALNSSEDPDGSAIASGQTLSGVINVPSDTDAFQFYGTAGDRVIINVVKTSGNLDTKIIVYPPGGGNAEALSSCTDIMGFYNGCRDQLDFQLQHAGLYTIVIQDYVVANSGSYNISLTKIPPDLRPGIYDPSPANGTTLCSVNGSFSWDPVAGATCYDLYFGEDVVTSLTKVGDCLPSASMPFPAMTTGKRYYWYVVAHTPAGDIQGPYWWVRVPGSESGWFDNFDSYALGTFPFVGGWSLWYDGGNQSNQYADNAHAVSGVQSLRLVGSAGFPAAAYREVGCLTKVALEADMFIDEVASCAAYPSGVLLGDLSSHTTFGDVRFQCDGYIYAVKDSINNVVEKLMPYSEQTWYHVKLDVDMSTMTFDVYIDGVLRGAGVQILNSGSPTGVLLVAGYATNPTAWFDNVNVGPSCAPPPAPVINDPGSSVSSGQTYAVSWSSVTGATDYEICEATDVGFTDQQCDTIGNTSKQYSHPNSGCTPLIYYYRVKARNDCWPSPFSTPPADMQVNGNTPPGVPTLLNPPNGTTNVSTTPILDWTDMAGATSYDVRVSSDSSCLSEVRSANVPISQWTVSPALNPGTLYYWCVRANNSCVLGQWSGARSLNTIGSVPSVPVMVNPPDGATGLSTIPTLDWSDVSEATSYDVHICTDVGCTSVVRSVNVPVSQWSVSPPLNLCGTYYWQVRANNSTGSSPWSGAWRFATACCQTVWSDNFDSYTMGTFPNSGEWQLTYNGAGTSYQYVDGTHSVSGNKSLHLVGSYCWAAHAYHPVNNIPSQVTLEVNVFIEKAVAEGCSPQIVAFGLENPSLGTWGTDFGRVYFGSDGKIYAVQAHYDRGSDVLLMPYNAGAWYSVRTEVDLMARSYDVHINGVLVASGVRILDSGMPTGVELSAGHGSSPTAWFDEVRVTSGCNETPLIQSLIIHYYRSILDREPDDEGLDFWTSEIERIVSRGIDISEGFQALAKVFLNSDEYLSKNKSNEAFVTDLYEAFLGRLPDDAGKVHWVNQLHAGLTRNMLITQFANSVEFDLYLKGILGTMSTRPENNLANDLYRGFLGRLPDSGGFNHWLKDNPTLMWLPSLNRWSPMNMRSAQCSGAAAVRSLTYQIALAFIQSNEYKNRQRNNNQYVEDLYNGILKRGADPAGFIHWVTLLNNGTYNREQMLLEFTNSPEFQTRVQAVIDAGCLP